MCIVLQLLIMFYTWSVKAASFVSGVKAEAIVCPTAVIASCKLSLLGHLAGLALNIGTSGVFSLVAVPTICRKKI